MKLYKITIIHEIIYTHFIKKAYDKNKLQTKCLYNVLFKLLIV